MANEPAEYRCATCGATQDKPWRCPGCDSVDVVAVPPEPQALVRQEPLTEREIAYGQEVARQIRRQEAEGRVIAAARAICNAPAHIPSGLLMDLEEAVEALDALRGT